MNNNIVEHHVASRWNDPARHLLSLPRGPRLGAALPAPTALPEPSGSSMLVFLVDADDGTRASMEAQVRAAGWCTESFATAEAFLARAPHAGPSCLVLDVDLPHAEGLALQRRIAAERAGMPIIVTSGRADVPVAVQAMKAGAVDFLTRPVCGHSLQRAIEWSVACSLAAMAQVQALRAVRARHAKLSRREREVMALVVTGLLNKQVGVQLGISEITVKAHRGSVMRKMDARTLPDLVNMANRLRGAPPLAA